MSGILRRSSTVKNDIRHAEEGCQTSPQYHDKGSVRFIDENNMNSLLANPVVPEEEDKDYSASVNEILHRRASSKKSKRRSSSPFTHEEYSGQSTPRRRSSVFTTSSETAITIDDAEIKEEQIYENIRLHKEVIANVKQQPWPIRRKLKLIQQAKAYVKRHEGELQVRLKQSRSTRDILTRFKIVLIKKWQHTKRELINFMNLLIPWELRIKEIESHFGTVVASYFTFLRWLFWMNLVISIVLTAFVIVPEVWLDKHRRLENRGYIRPNETRITLDMILNFEGILEYSPLFYGYYSFRQRRGKYRIPIAYFMIGIGMYIYSFIATLRKMAVNFRLSKLSEKEDECIFTWKLFSGWDYMIGNAETSHNRTSSIILGFKEALLEEAEKRKEKRSWKLISIRVFVNLNVLWMLIFSVKAVVSVVNKSNDREGKIEVADSFLLKWWYQNETTVVMTVIGNVFPFIFEMFGFIEKYHPRKTLRIQLGRIMALNLLNLYSLTFAQFNQIGSMASKLESYRSNLTNTTLENFSSQAISAPLTGYEESNSYNMTDRWQDFLTFPLVIDKESAAFSTPLAASLVDANFSFINPTANTEGKLKDQFLKNIEPLKDPATGKYNKTLLKMSTKPMKVTENLILDLTAGTTNDWSETIQFLENENYSSTEYYRSTSTIMTAENFTVSENFSSNFEDVQTDDELTENSSTDRTFPAESLNISSMSPNTTIWDDNNTVSTTETAYSELPIERITTTINHTQERVVHSTKKSYVEIINHNATSSNNSTQLLNFTYDGKNSTIQLNLSIPATTVVKVIKATSPSTNSSSNTIAADGVGMATNQSVPPADVCSSAKEEEALSDEKIEELSKKVWQLDLDTRQKVRKLCWETMFGQELVKLTVADFISNIVSTFFGDFIRALLVRYMNKFWCWDLEKKFPKYADFKIAENILHLVNNQGQVWMGMFFSPGLPLINVIKLMLMMYLRSWAVLTCNVPHEVVFRASRSNNFYLALLLMMLFLCMLPVCYAVVILKPSWHCGPFSNYKRIYIIFATTLKNSVPTKLHRIMDYMATPGTVIPLIIILLLIIYYLASLTSALREANIDLKIQLRRERTEERKKMFQMASRRKRGSDIDSTFAKWKKILQEEPSTKLSEDSEIYDLVKDKKDDPETVPKPNDEDIQKVKKLFTVKIKTESTSERKWGTLLKMMPKPKTDMKDKPSLQGSPLEASEKNVLSQQLDVSPENMMNLTQPDNNDKPKSKSISKISYQDRGTGTPKAFASKPSLLDRWRKKTSFKSTFDSDVDAATDTAQEEVDDDVFLDSKEEVDIPELPKIPESISNRIKRRLQKVISMGSSSENQFYKDLERKETAVNLPLVAHGKRSDLHLSSSNLSPKYSLKFHSPVRLRRSNSLNLNTIERWRMHQQKRSLSQSAITYPSYGE